MSMPDSPDLHHLDDHVELAHGRAWTLCLGRHPEPHLWLIGTEDERLTASTARDLGRALLAAADTIATAR